jgi:aminoglycoside phosphotransferase
LLRELEQVVRSRWEEFGYTGKRPERFMYVLSGERHSHSKAVLFCLPDDRSAPAVIVKIQKDDLHLPLLENEHLHLRALHAHEGLGELRQSIPRPLFYGQVADHPVLIESYMPGIPFSKHSRRRDPRSFLKLSEWLRAFHMRTLGQARILTEHEVGVYFFRRLESAMQVINGHRSLQLFLGGFGRRLQDLAGAKLSFVFSHNDLCLSNVRFDGERISVIDWEFAGYPDLPLLDLINAFLFFAMTWGRLNYIEAFRGAFFGHNGLSLLFRQCLDSYVRDVGLPPGMLHLLLVQYLVSRIPLLRSIGNMSGLGDTLQCLGALAEDRVAQKSWTDIEMCA